MMTVRLIMNKGDVDSLMRRRDFIMAGAALLGKAQAQPRITLPSVLGPMRPFQLGMTLPHEHIASASQEITREQRDSIRCLWGMLGAQLRENGVRSIVDLTPADSGRNISLMREVSEATGLNILCATGYYLSHARPANFLTGGVDAAETYMTGELVDGIGESGVRPALIKIAVGGMPGTPPDNTSDNILLEAAGRTQKKTGKPISCHATTPDHRRHLLDLLEKHGADMSRVAVGHADTNGTIKENIEVLKRAGYVIHTVWGVTNSKPIGSHSPLPPDHSARLLCGLLEKGLVKQVMFSVDFGPICLRGGGIELRLYEVPERSSNFAFTFILPQLKKLGVSESEIHQMMVVNPRHHLCGPDET